MNSYIYNLSKSTTDIIWGLNLGYINSIFNVEKYDNNYILIGTYGSQLLINDTDHVLRNRTNFTVTSTNNQMNIFIALINNTGYVQDVLRLSGTGTIYKPILFKIIDTDFLLIFKTNGQPIFTRLIDRSMTAITGQGGTEDVYIVKYNKNLECIWYARISMNSGDIIRKIDINTNIILSGITSVQNPVYETSYGKKYKIDTPIVNNKRGFKIKIKI
jgi:hypothetical protein